MMAEPRRLVSLVPLALLVACGTESGKLPSEVQRGIAADRVSSDLSPWSEPVNLGPVVNGESLDQDPALSADELSLYFASDRPGGYGIWASRRDCRTCPWKTPLKLQLVPDDFEGGMGPTQGVGTPELSPDGHLLFVTRSEIPPGSPPDAFFTADHNIYVARRIDPKNDFGWGPLERLGPEVNTSAREDDPAYLEAGEGGPYLYFAREFTPFAFDFDIYVVPITRDGKTRGPAALVSELRPPYWAPTQVLTKNPQLSADGREMIFTTAGRVDNIGGAGGPGGLFVSTRQSTHDPWSTPHDLGSPPNTEFGEGPAALSHDGRTLIFASGRPGGQGGLDLWMSTRRSSGH